MITILINDKKYKVKEARTSEQRKKGLLNIESLPKDEGMLFFYDSPENISMWMKDVKIPLDIIFFNEDLEAIKVVEGKPNDDTLIPCSEVMYVLEVNKDSGIKEGDSFDFEDNLPVMKVLLPDGSTLMELWGGERIFRRAFTRLLINLCKKAKECALDSSELISLYKRIGKKMFKEILALDNRKPEYVTKPDE